MDTHNIMMNNQHNLHASNNKADLSEILVNSLIIKYISGIHYTNTLCKFINLISKNNR